MPSGYSVRRKLQTWWTDFGSVFPSALSPYWRALPVGRMKTLLAGAFLVAAAAGFAADLLQLDASRVGRGFFWPLFAGAAATAGLIVVIKNIRLILVVYVAAILTAWIGYRAGHSSQLPRVPEALQRRVVFDAVGILFAIAVGSRLLMVFAGSQGLVNTRLQTELALAHAIQATLVPTISFQNAGFEAYGKSIPSKEMGGDLVDVIEREGSLLAYVADVSGHGLAAGQLMGMLKTSMRLAVQFRQQPTALLESADRVLPGLKGPEMYATLALLYFQAPANVEYALAGHVPILHYNRRSRSTGRLSMEQFPLGLMPGACYASQRVAYSPGDVFLLLTDGICEVSNARDEEFGITRLEQLLTEHATRPLPQIWETIMAQVKHHGEQEDDQSMLLLRVRDLDVENDLVTPLRLASTKIG
jgi:serine phosphatase RsbU (regulator of sigma subunit)